MKLVGHCTEAWRSNLSVSSNGSLWVKPVCQKCGVSRSSLSVSSNGSLWVKLIETIKKHTNSTKLSVSSNGSLWVKHPGGGDYYAPLAPFSILERIVVGETQDRDQDAGLPAGLSVSSNGSLWVKHRARPAVSPSAALSVSSNGSLWVKLTTEYVPRICAFVFQYPRTDRCG